MPGNNTFADIHRSRFTTTGCLVYSWDVDALVSGQATQKYLDVMTLCLKMTRDILIFHTHIHTSHTIWMLLKLYDAVPDQPPHIS